MQGTVTIWLALSRITLDNDLYIRALRYPPAGTTSFFTLMETTIEGNLPLKSHDDANDWDETQLLSAVRRNPHEFGRLYLRYLNPVFRYLYSRTGSIQEAEDLTAETFLAALEAFPRFRGEWHFSSWLFGIAHHKAIDYYRKRKPNVALEEANNLLQHLDPLSETIHTEQATKLSRLINDLNEQDRELLRLRYLAELSYAEMGKLLRRSEAAVKKATYRLLARLQSQMEDPDE